MSLGSPASRRLAGSRGVLALAAVFSCVALFLLLSAPQVVAGQAASLVINEVDYDQPSTDTAEFIELYNAGATPVSLDGYSIEFINGSGGGAANYKTVVLPAQTLPAGGFFVVCADPLNTPNCDLDVSPNSNLIQNGAPDAVALRLSGAIVEALSYEGSVPGFTEGAGAGADSSSASFVGLSRTPNGFDSDNNSTDFTLRCSTPGAANSTDSSNCPDPNGDPDPDPDPGNDPILPLVVNEIDYDQPGSDTAEFVEILNTSASPVSLAGVSLQLVNGNGGVVYQTINFPAVTLAGNDYYVVCANAASTPECDLDAISSVQNGAPDAVAVLSGNTILDTVSYEGDVPGYVEGSGVGLIDFGTSGNDLKGISRFPDGADLGQNNTDFVFACITPGAANVLLDSGCALGPGIELEIFEIQGDGLDSPYEGQRVITENNVVTSVGTNGFFMQTPEARSDNNVDTSDGIFVFTSGAPAVAAGDLVSVTGVVDEFFGFTELTNVSIDFVAPGGGIMPAPVVFGPTLPSRDPTVSNCAIEFECWEGMYISVPQGAVGSGNQGFGSDPVAEVYVRAGARRAFREPGIEFPGLSGLPVWDGNPEIFELDPDKLGLPNQVIPGGSRFSALGGLGYEFGGYELWPSELDVSPATLPRAVRDKRRGEYTVGTLNLFRLFDDVDDPGIGENVVDTAEYNTRLAKFSMYIRGLMRSPDILGVQEVENLEVLQDLAAQIAADDPSVRYMAYLEEGNDIGGIDVGFLVRDHVQVTFVEQLGATETLSVDGSLLHDRPPLVLGARIGGSRGRGGDDDDDDDDRAGNRGGQQITVMVVHNRSLSGIDDDDDGPRVRQKRLEQAQSIARKVQRLQRRGGGLVVVGDFNAFEFTDSYVDVVGQIKGDFEPSDNLLFDSDLVRPDLTNVVDRLPHGERYSFIFRGSAQTLDHGLVTRNLRNRVRGAGFARGNADAAEEFELDGSTPLRSSDHDGLVIFLRGPVGGDDDDDDS